MDKVLGRMRTVFRRNPAPQKLPRGTYPNPSGNAPTLGTITKPTYTTDDDDDEIESSRNYNVTEQTRLRRQPTDPFETDDTSPSREPYSSTSFGPPGPLLSSNSPFGNTSGGFLPRPSINNNNTNSSPNANTGTISNPPSRPGAPFASQTPDSSSRSVQNPTPTLFNNAQSSSGGIPRGTDSNQFQLPPPLPPPLTGNSGSPFGGFPPGINPNQPAPPPPNNSQPSSGGFPPGINPNQPAPPPPNNSQPSSGGFPPGINPNQPAPPPPNNFQSSSDGFTPDMNVNRAQSPANISQSYPDQNFPGMNRNQTSSSSTVPNLQPSSAGFQPGPNARTSFSQSNIPLNNSMNPPQGMLSSFRNQSNADNDNQSRLELDYPIENVLIDANIPSAMAIKINDVVEQDRFGNRHRIHRYTFEPPGSQHISFANHQQNNQRSAEKPFHGGTRHIREIHDDDYGPLSNDSSYPHSSKTHSGRRHHHDHYSDAISNDLSYPHNSKTHSRRRHHHDYYPDTPLNQYIDQLLHTSGSTVIQAQGDNGLQRILNQQFYPQLLPAPPSTNVFQLNSDLLPGPVFYYTARALHNDPMRNY